jgi:hypothetical protein
VLVLESLQPEDGLPSSQIRVSAVREVDEEPGVEPAHGFCLVRCLELLARELPDRLQHPEAPVRVTEEVLLEERLEGVKVGLADLLCSLERAAAREDGKAGEEVLLVRG